MRASLLQEEEDSPFIILHSVLKHTLKSGAVISTVVVLTSDLSLNSRWNIIYNNTLYPLPTPSHKNWKASQIRVTMNLGPQLRRKFSRLLLCVFMVPFHQNTQWRTVLNDTCIVYLDTSVIIFMWLPSGFFPFWMTLGPFQDDQYSCSKMSRGEAGMSA